MQLTLVERAHIGLGTLFAGGEGGHSAVVWLHTKPANYAAFMHIGFKLVVVSFGYSNSKNKTYSETGIAREVML